MVDSISTRAGTMVIVTGEQRTGQCEVCGTTTEKEYHMEDKRKRVRMVCPKCGGMGRLIVRTTSVQSPQPPRCVRPSCLFKFFRDTLFCALLSAYHARRVHYATINRNKKILERYRTGNPSPETIWQVIHALTKLKCPVCRRYNVDPLLFSDMYKRRDSEQS